MPWKSISTPVSGHAVAAGLTQLTAKALAGMEYNQERYSYGTVQLRYSLFHDSVH